MSGTSTCVFALHGVPISRAQRRAEALLELFAPLGPAIDSAWIAPLGLLLGVVRFAGAAALSLDARPLVVTWGDVPNAGDPVWSRRLETSGLAITADDRHAEITVGAAGPTACYEWSGDSARAWSSHAAAAAVLSGRPKLASADAIPQLLALGFVGGDGTLFDGIVKSEPASRVTITPRSLGRTIFWSEEERFGPIPRERAMTHAEQHLIASFRERLGELRRPMLGLTAGADSTVVAAALVEAGVDFEAFTWGPTGDPDVQGAVVTARELGLRHTVLSGGWLAADEMDASVVGQAVWTDGLGEPAVLGQPQYPAGCGALIMGAGGETGRAWHYKTLAACYTKPTSRQILRVWRPEMRLGTVEPAPGRGLRAEAARWLEQARSHGYEGWASLDFVYSEQRFRCWGRSMVARLSFPLIAGFGHPEVQRGLMSMAISDKLTDEFHRRFLSARHLSLALAVPRLQRAGIPRALRRGVTRWRQRARPGLVWALERASAERLRDQVVDDVTRRPFLADALGDAGAADLRSRFLNGEGLAIEHALRLVSVAALEDQIDRATEALRPA